MVFKYNFIRPKGKGRKDGSKGYLTLADGQRKNGRKEGRYSRGAFRVA